MQNILKELKLLWELSGNLKLTEIHKIISNESEKFEQSSTLNASLLKKLIDEIKDKAIKKRQEIMNNIRLKNIYQNRIIKQF